MFLPTFLQVFKARLVCRLHSTLYMCQRSLLNEHSEEKDCVQLPRPPASKYHSPYVSVNEPCYMSPTGLNICSSLFAPCICLAHFVGYVEYDQIDRFIT